LSQVDGSDRAGTGARRREGQRTSTTADVEHLPVAGVAAVPQDVGEQFGVVLGPVHAGRVQHHEAGRALSEPRQTWFVICA
jgi:hypothetical protein